MLIDGIVGEVHTYVLLQGYKKGRGLEHSTSGTCGVGDWNIKEASDTYPGFEEGGIHLTVCTISECAYA